MRDLPINGEGSDGIQYDYYLKDVSIVFPEIEEDRAKEPAKRSVRSRGRGLGGSCRCG